MNPILAPQTAPLLELIERWAQCGWLRALDAAFAAFLAREVADAPPLLILAAALASHQLGRGHACLDLADTLRDPGFALSLPPEGDPTRHAELVAAGLAARRLSPEQLAAATLYTSAEPCAMCAGAIYWCGIGRVVYALSEHQLLGLTGDHPENPTFALPCREVFARGQRRIEVTGPCLEEEAAAAHAGFWQRP